MPVRETHSTTRRPLDLEDRTRRDQHRREAQTLQRSITIRPTAGNDWAWFCTSVPLRVKELRVVQNGTSVTWSLFFDRDRLATNPAAVVRDVVTTAANVPDTLTRLESAVVPPDVIVWLDVTANVGGATELHVTLVPIVGGA